MAIFKETQLVQVARFLRLGGVLAYPSESVWGMGCDAFDECAIRQVLYLKSRTKDKGLIVLTDSVQKILPLLVDLPSDTQEQILDTLHATSNSTKNQATTWLLPISSLDMPDLLTGAFDSLAVRVTTHPVLVQLCKLMTHKNNPYGFLVSTSCNPSGQKPATDLNMAYQYFQDKISYLDSFPLGFDKPSRIIDAQTGAIIR